MYVYACLIVHHVLEGIVFGGENKSDPLEMQLALSYLM